MRIWDLSPEVLCRAHLLGEHRELHAIWSVLTKGKKGYANHPEVIRWRGRLGALYNRHVALVEEMDRRGYQHQSPLCESLATGDKKQEKFIHTPKEQVEILRKKKCKCRI